MLQRDEFDAWLAEFRKVAPGSVPNDARKLDEYFRHIQFESRRVGLETIRRALASKLERARRRA